MSTSSEDEGTDHFVNEGEGFQHQITLGVTGSISCYKACDLTSRLTQEGVKVQVVMTESATSFVTPESFKTLSRQSVYTSLFPGDKPEKPAHIELVERSEAFLIAPATGNLIGKIANGIADDLLTSLMLANNLRVPVMIAPAMNSNMYNNPLFQQNLSTLQDLGYRFVEPEEGYMACGDLGKGRLAEPETILEEVRSILGISKGKETE